MAKAGYSIQTGAAVALAAATAKSILGVIAPSQFGIDLRSLEISFDGSAAAAAVLVEVCTCTNATNVTPGTNNTTGTVNQTYGRSITAGFTGFYGCTSEPTVLTPVDSFTVPPNGGLVIRDWAYAQGLDTGVSTSFVVRCTSPVVVNARSTLHFERC